MSKIKNFARFIRITVAFIALMHMDTAKAFDPKHDVAGDVYVIINYTNAKLSQVFDQIEKQTSFSFIYDENDINLSKEIKLTKGEQRLNDLLLNISRQAGIRFTEKQNIILVSQDHGIKSAVFTAACWQQDARCGVWQGTS